MNDKCSIIFLASSILIYLVSSVWRQEITASEITFTCEDNNGTPITVARDKKGQTQTVFYWKEEAFKYRTALAPKKLCDSTILKLNNLSANGYNLSSFILSPWETQDGFPAICMGFSPSVPCGRNRQFIFTLQPSYSSLNVAADILEQIINTNISENKKHGVDQRYSHGYYVINLYHNEE